MLPLLHLKAERNPSAGQAAHSFELSRIFILRKYNWDFKNIADMKNLKHKKMMEIINAEGQWSAGGRIKSEAPTKGSSQNKFSVKVGNLAQPAWPPPAPLPVRWDSQKGKKNYVYFAF